MILRVFVLLLSFLVSVKSTENTLNDDILGLIVFKADLLDPFSKLASWNEDDENPCNWVGIKCNPRNNRVSDVVLDGFSLSGRLGRGLLQLQFIRTLSLSKNNFTGNLNPDLTRLENLRYVYLNDNSLSGAIPDDFFRHCGSLRELSLARNKFSGAIPTSLGLCSTLASINFSSNQLSGSLPTGLWALNTLRDLDLSDNSLIGSIPREIKGLLNLRTINLAKNKFSGQLPDDIGDCSLLKSIDFSENDLSGELPLSMQRLTTCTSLSLSKNSFVGTVPTWLEELKGLEILDLSSNGFNGLIPHSVGNLQSLKVLNLSMNFLTAGFPESMTNCKSLTVVDFSRNSLTGNLPPWIFSMGLQEIFLSRNGLGGAIENPPSVSTDASNQKLQILDLSCNRFSGNIPSNIGTFSNLKYLNLSQNSFMGVIPGSVGLLKDLGVLDLSDNRLNGTIPSEIGAVLALKDLRLKNNLLTDKIPIQIGKCSYLLTLILSQNNLSGPIPSSIANLTNIQILDFSHNNLSGTIPKQFADLSHLLSFNVSHNDLEGDLPTGSFFNTILPSSVSNNPSLCGSIVNRSCSSVLPKPIVLNPNSSTENPSNDGTPNPFSSNLRHKKIILSISALVAIGAAALIAVGVAAVTVLNLRVQSSTSRSAMPLTLSGAGDEFSCSPTSDTGAPNSGKLVLFSGDLDLSIGTHALLNKDHELGRGGFGSVYQTLLSDGRPIAIKKLTVSSLVKSQDDFEKEVQKLGKIRHQNLVSLEGFYWTPSLQLLIYEFVSGGTLYKQLHESSKESSLSWQERFNIILGTAKGLAHLHCSGIIHYNLKSSNILLDGSGKPKVGDFGLAKLLPMLDRYVLSSKIQSALGYMAPEFACRMVKITEKCDVYGFGVLVLEVVTGRRPIEYMEDDVVVLCDMVRGALDGGRVENCVDRRLKGAFPIEEAVPVMKLGLICTSQVPSNRPDMNEVVNILELIGCSSEGQEEELS